MISMIDILCLSIISFIIYYGCKPSDNRGGTTLWSHVRHSRWCHHDGPSSEGRWRHGIHQTPCILPTFGSPTWTQVFSEDGFHTSSSWVLAIPRKKSATHWILNWFSMFVNGWDWRGLEFQIGISMAFPWFKQVNNEWVTVCFCFF